METTVVTIPLATSAKTDELSRDTACSAPFERELRGLYELYDESNKPSNDAQSVIHHAMGILANLWGPETVAGIRVILGEIEYRSCPMEETSFRRSCPIYVRGETEGALDIFFRSQAAAGGACLSRNGEVLFLRALANRLGGLVEQQQAKEEHDRLEKQFNLAQKLDAVGQLAGGVAHDFNNLLTVILHATERLRLILGEDPQSGEPITAIELAARQAIGVIRSLLSFSQAQPPAMKPLNLSALVEDYAMLLRRTLPTSVRLNLTIRKGDSDLWIKGDSALIQQMLLNLVINARDAMPNGGNLDISIDTASPADGQTAPPKTVAGEYVRLTVADTGQGIPKELASRVFEPFFTTKPRGRGTGLGLAMVHGLVRRHGGWVTFDSEVGRGSSFHLFLPQTKPRRAQEKQPPHKLQGHGEMLLLAGGDPHTRGLMIMGLESLGYVIVSADNEAALRQRWVESNGGIRAMILDAPLASPEVDKWLRELRGNGRRIPVIIICSGEAKDTAREYDSHTVLLQKPFRTTELGRLILGLLAEVNQEKETS